MYLPQLRDCALKKSISVKIKIFQKIYMVKLIALIKNKECTVNSVINKKLQ